MLCLIQLQVVLHFHNPVPVRLDSSLMFLLCHLSMLSPLVELLYMSELRRSLLIYTAHLQPMLNFLLEVYLQTLQVVIFKYELALLDCSLLHGVFPWILSYKQVSEEIWSLVNLKFMVVVMLFVLLLIVRRNPKLLHTKSIYINPLLFVGFFFISFPELPYTGKTPRFMYLFQEFIFKDISKPTSILPFYYHPKHCREICFLDNGKYGYLVFGLCLFCYSKCQNTFIFSRGEIQVPVPL